MPDSRLTITDASGNVRVFQVVHDSLLPKGKRAVTRRNRAAQPSDPGALVQMTWKLHGPIGLSREGPSGELGHDFGTLETRFDDLLTSLPEVNAVDLDP